MKPRKVVIHNYLPSRRAARDATMGTYCKHCGYKAGSHQAGTLNCPKNGPGSGFNPNQKFSAVETKDSTGAFLSGSARRNNNQLEHPSTVSREEEERHRDAAYRRTGITRVKDSQPKPSDPAYERWAQQQREEQNRGGGGNYDFQRYSGDVIWIDVPESEYNKLNNGSSAGKIEGREATVVEKDIVSSRVGAGNKYRVKVRLK